MSTLKNLVQKGVKVDLGMPLELWDEPSVEVTHMKKQVGSNKQLIGVISCIFFISSLSIKC